MMIKVISPSNCETARSRQADSRTVDEDFFAIGVVTETIAANQADGVTLD
jgi:hypothetical protein